MNVEQDGFFVELTFVRRVDRSGEGGGKKGNPGRIVWKKNSQEETMCDSHKKSRG